MQCKDEPCAESNRRKLRFPPPPAQGLQADWVCLQGPRYRAILKTDSWAPTPGRSPRWIPSLENGRIQGNSRLVCILAPASALHSSWALFSANNFFLLQRIFPYNLQCGVTAVTGILLLISARIQPEHPTARPGRSGRTVREHPAPPCWRHSLPSPTCQGSDEASNIPPLGPREEAPNSPHSGLQTSSMSTGDTMLFREHTPSRRPRTPPHPWNSLYECSLQTLDKGTGCWNWMPCLSSRRRHVGAEARRSRDQPEGQPNPCSD